MRLVCSSVSDYLAKDADCDELKAALERVPDWRPALMLVEPPSLLAGAACCWVPTLGNRGRHYFEDCYIAGAVDFIEKPFKADRVQEAVAKALASPPVAAPHTPATSP